MVPTAGLPLDDFLAVALLTWFGVQTLRSAATADTTAAEEKEEAQEVVDGFGSGEPACLCSHARAAAAVLVCCMGGLLYGWSGLTAVRLVGLC